MPLPQIDLDDKTFEGLVAEATKLIPRQSPGWSDHNRHDPGITLVELFAWLTEMQHYYLNRVGDANYLKFLKLVGITPAGAMPARAEVVFAHKDLAANTTMSGSVVSVPQGSRLSAQNVPFETTEPLAVVPVRLTQVLSSSSVGFKDNTAANQITGLSFAAFGDEAEPGSRCYIGFDRALPAGERLSLTFNLFEDYLVERGVHGAETPDITPSALVVWEYYNGTTWAALELIAALEPIIMAATQGIAAHTPLCMSKKQNLRTRITSAPLFMQLTPETQHYVISLVDQAHTPAALSRLLTDQTLLRLKQDETLMLSQSGRLFFTVPDDMQSRTINPFPATLFWLRATVRQGGYELPPRIDTVAINTAPALQRETLSEVLTFSSNGQPDQSFTASTYLAITGDALVHVQEQDGRWAEWQQHENLDTSGPDDPHYTLTIDTSGTTIAFGDGIHGQIPPAGNNNIRLIACRWLFSQRRLIGRSNGLPSQTFLLDETPVLADLLIQVEQQVQHAGQTLLRWRDWTRVADLDASGPQDAHYMLDTETGQIRFGDGINGDIPDMPDDPLRNNIRVIQYRVGGGTHGNLLDGTITQIIEPAGDVARLTVTNPRPASDGTAKDTLAALQTKARQDFTTRFRAVTSDDYEFLARATPGLRVARARAIPLFAPGMTGYPQNSHPAAVTVVVVPHSQATRPTPGQGFLQTVCRHLDQHRLVTTRVYVVPPDYVGVSVYASVQLRGGFAITDIRQQIETALNAFLHPLNGGPDQNGWPFGRSVYKSEVYQVIERVAGVDCVARLALNADGTGATRDAQGNIAISPQSLVFAGTHRIDITSADPVCR